MMYEDKNVYSEKLANDVQLKLSGFPFAPQNFKLSYDLDSYEAERNSQMNAEKLHMKIQEENKNSRLFFEAIKLRNLSKHPLKSRPNSANSRPNSGKDVNGNTYQSQGKFYHLNFEPIRIEDYKQIEDDFYNNDNCEVNNNYLTTSPTHNNYSTKHTNVLPNVTDVNNNQSPCVPIIKNSPFTHHSSPQSIKLHKKKPFISNREDGKLVLASVSSSKFVKKGGNRKLPRLPSAPPVSRLSSTVPDLIATTKMPSVAEEIMAVYATEKKKHKLAANACLSFSFPYCCSPEIIFGLQNEPENSAQHTMKDLGHPEVIDPVKKYSDLYLNESYVKNIICFKCGNLDQMYERLKADEEEEEDEDEKENDEDAMMDSLNECKETPPSLLPPTQKEPSIDKINPFKQHLNTKDKSHDAYTEPPNVTQTMDCLKTPPSCASVDSGINLSRINSANSRGSDGHSDEALINNNSINNSINKNSSTNNNSLMSSSSSSDMSSSVFGGFAEIENYLDDGDASHRGCHKFLPRHPEELAVEIGDGLFVEKEHDDLWCEGINLRTKQKGIFPTAYATDLSLLAEVPKYKQFVSYLGSIEIGQHMGHQILCKAIKKLVRARKESKSPKNEISCLEIDENGIRVSDRKKKTATSRILSKLPLHNSCHQITEHVYMLKNITFCGILPNNERYLGFITKHPVCMKFACHVFQAPKSGRPIVEAIGTALSRFHQEYLSVAYPVEDIYFE